MATGLSNQMTGKVATRALSESIESQAMALTGVAEALKTVLDGAMEAGGAPARSVKDFLNGTWLGHPLHAAISDAPIGSWLGALVLDIAGSRHADKLVQFGVIAAVPTALAGVADWHNIQKEQKPVGVVHATANSVALVCYIGSLVARRNERRPLGIGLSTAGFLIVLAGAYLGGHLVYSQGTNVDRNAWMPEDEEEIARWQAVARLDNLAEGSLSAGEITLEGEKIPLALLRRGRDVYAIVGKCSHMGGPLAEGKLLDDDCVECPWHGSTFQMKDGSNVHGPSAYPQPRFETRVRNGEVEVRLAKQ